MKQVSFKKEIDANLEVAIKKVEAAIKPEGFGLLTRIDFDKKMKEKLNKDMAPLVILGACNPNLAFEAYQMKSDVTALLPCNIIVREIGKDRVSIEVAKPSAIMEILGDQTLVNLAKDADMMLARALESIK